MKTLPLFLAVLMSTFILPSIVHGQKKWESREDRQERLANQLRSDAKKYKDAAEKQKGDYAQLLYSLSEACREEAAMHTKLVESYGNWEDQSLSATYEKRLDNAIARVEGLKKKLIPFGWKEPDIAADPSGKDGDNTNPALVAVNRWQKRMQEEFERQNDIVDTDAPERAKLRQEFIDYIREQGANADKLLSELKIAERRGGDNHPLHETLQTSMRDFDEKCKYYRQEFQKFKRPIGKNPNKPGHPDREKPKP